MRHNTCDRCGSESDNDCCEYTRFVSKCDENFEELYGIACRRLAYSFGLDISLFEQRDIKVVVALIQSGHLPRPELFTEELLLLFVEGKYGYQWREAAKICTEDCRPAVGDRHNKTCAAHKLT